MLWIKLLFIFSTLLNQTFVDYRSINTSYLLDSTASINYIDSSQVVESILIHKIKIIGNDKTKPETILRELSFKENSYVTQADLKFNESRVMSLGLFSDVKFIVDKNDDENILYILVQESWYIWPFPYIDIVDRDWKKLVYGMNVTIQNLTGRNESLNFNLHLGYDPGFYISYFNPIFSSAYNLLFRIKTEYVNRKIKSKKYISTINSGENSEDYFTAEFTIGKRFNLYNTLFLSLSYDFLKTNNFELHKTISDDGKDRFISFQIAHSYDTRDFTAYPKNGLNINFAYKKSGLGKSGVDYSTLTTEIKKIQLIKFPIIYLRNYSRILIGPKLPYYASSYLGYNERLRGYFNEIFENHSLNLSTIELRFPLVEKFLLSLDFPIIPKSLLTYNLSFDFHLFFDSALMWDKNDKLANKKFKNGYGAGISILILPYRSINFELAYNSELKPEFIIDLKTPF